MAFTKELGFIEELFAYDGLPEGVDNDETIKGRLLAELKTISPIAFHHAYDGAAYLGNREVAKFLEAHPQGLLAQALLKIGEGLVGTDQMSPELAEKYYGYHTPKAAA
jgi:hypothetical protein